MASHNYENSEGLDVAELFRKVFAEEGVGAPHLSMEIVDSVNRLISGRFASVKSSGAARDALEEFVALRIRYWASKKGYTIERISMWDVEEAKARLLNAFAAIKERRKADIEALQQQLKNLLEDARGLQ